jgi:hypothetical protein
MLPGHETRILGSGDAVNAELRVALYYITDGNGNTPRSACPSVTPKFETENFIFLHRQHSNIITECCSLLQNELHPARRVWFYQSHLPTYEGGLSYHGSIFFGFSQTIRGSNGVWSLTGLTPLIRQSHAPRVKPVPVT